MRNGELITLQNEKFEYICKKLQDEREKLSDEAVETKLLSSSIPKFSTFRTWEITPVAERKNDALIAQLIREEERLCKSDNSASFLALQTQALHLQNIQSGGKSALPKDSSKSSEKKMDAKKRIEKLKQENAQFARGKDIGRESAQTRNRVRRVGGLRDHRISVTLRWTQLNRPDQQRGRQRRKLQQRGWQRRKLQQQQSCLQCGGNVTCSSRASCCSRAASNPAHFSLLFEPLCP